MMKRSGLGGWTAALVGASLLVALGCTPGESTPHGFVRVSAALGAEGYDVAGFLFEIQCLDGFTLTEYVPLESESMPPWLDPNAGPNHAFADLLAAVPDNRYDLVGAGPSQGLDDMRDKGPAVENMKHLGQVGAHSHPFTRRENYCLE